MQHLWGSLHHANQWTATSKRTKKKRKQQISNPVKRFRLHLSSSPYDILIAAPCSFSERIVYMTIDTSNILSIGISLSTYLPLLPYNASWLRKNGNDVDAIYGVVPTGQREECKGHQTDQVYPCTGLRSSWNSPPSFHNISTKCPIFSTSTFRNTSTTCPIFFFLLGQMEGKKRELPYCLVRKEKRERFVGLQQACVLLALWGSLNGKKIPVHSPQRTI